MQQPWWNVYYQTVLKPSDTTCMNGGKGRVIECMHALCNLCILLYGLIDFPCQYAMYIHVYTHIDDVYVGIHFGIKCTKPTYISTCSPSAPLNLRDGDGERENIHLIAYLHTLYTYIKLDWIALYTLFTLQHI